LTFGSLSFAFPGTHSSLSQPQHTCNSQKQVYSKEQQFMLAGSQTMNTRQPSETVLKSHGYDVVPQVGVSGYFIDLGVRHAFSTMRTYTQ
jgi:hypothetical protein